MRIYQFYTAATANVGIQMLTKGNIVCVWWSAMLTSNAAGDGVTAELSYSQTNQMAVNNPVGVISAYSGRTSAIYIGFPGNAFHGGLFCPVNQGDIIYLNATITNGANIRALLHVQEGR
jgi:hypothetical protein